MRSHLLLLLLFLLLVLPAVPAASVGLAAGTQIHLVANASFTDAQQQLINSDPASVTLSVLHVAGVSVDETGQHGQATPSQSIYIPITITNTGNSSDTFTLSASSASSWDVDIIYDDNADGIHQDDEQWVITTAGPMVADGYSPCFAKITVPANAASNDTVTVTAVSTYNAQATDQLQLSVDVLASPTVTITAPTGNPTYSAANPSVDLAGTTAGELALTEVAWATDHGTSGTCDGTSTWTASDIELVPGPNVITITATDSGPRTGTATLTVVYTDTTAPSVAITAPVATATYTTSNQQLAMSGTSSDNDEVETVFWSNSRGGAGVCTGTSAWSIAAVPLALGQNVITVSASDEAGNVATKTLTVTRTDATPPVVAITAPVSSTTYATNNPQITVAGTASDNVGVTTVSWSNDRGGSGACTGTAAWGIDLIDLTSGINVITISASDATGNVGTKTLTVTYTPDALAPTISITSPTSSAVYTTDDPAFSLSGTAADSVGVQSVSWTNDRGGSGTCSGTTSWSASGITLLRDQNVITVTATNASGKTATDVIMVTYTGLHAPAVSITGPTANPTYSTSSKSLNIAGTAAHDIGIESVTWSNSRGGSGSCTGTTAWTATGLVLKTGSNVITVTATSALDVTATDTLTVTCTAPTVAITAPTSAAVYATQQASLSLGGTATDDIAVTSVTWSNNRGGSGTCSGTGTWTASGIPLLSGQNVLTVTASDAAGNSGTCTLTVTRSTETTKPVILVTTPTNQGQCSRNCPLLTIGGTASDNTAVTGVTWTNAATGGTGACTLVGANWSATGLSLVLGDNIITATARDAAGNTASASVTVSYIDVTPGTAWAGMAMVSLPIIPDQVDPKLETGFLDNMWCTFIPAINSYAVYPDERVWLSPADETPGRGFWARFDTPAVVPYGTIPAQDQPVTIHLTAGWNLVGTPFISDVIWDTANLMVRESNGPAIPMSDAPDLMSGYAWGWKQDTTNPNSGAYILIGDASAPTAVENRIEPWRAYWIRAYRDCDLILPAPL